MAIADHDLDLIEELRLRRWVRLNYRRMQSEDFEMSGELHPVMQHELDCIKNEHAEVQAASVADAFVPLNPEPFSTRIDAAHEADVSKPHFSAYANTEVYVETW